MCKFIGDSSSNVGIIAGAAAAVGGIIIAITIVLIILIICYFGRRKSMYICYVYMCMLNKNTWGLKKCGANQKQHCKQAGTTKRFDIS